LNAIYLDASLLVSLFIDDLFTFRAKAFLQREAWMLLVSDLAAAEFASAIARHVRMRNWRRPTLAWSFLILIPGQPARPGGSRPARQILSLQKHSSGGLTFRCAHPTRSISQRRNTSARQSLHLTIRWPPAHARSQRRWRPPEAARQFSLAEACRATMVDSTQAGIVVPVAQSYSDVQSAASDLICIISGKRASCVAGRVFRGGSGSEEQRLWR
jgi:hypothetical protein